MASSSFSFIQASRFNRSNQVDDNSFALQGESRRERAAAYGKLLKLRDTDGFRKQFQ